MHSDKAFVGKDPQANYIPHSQRQYANNGGAQGAMGVSVSNSTFSVFNSE